MQGEAHLPEEVLAVEQFAVLGPVEETVAGHLEQGGGAEVAAGDPGQGLDVAKASRIVLEIRLQLVGGAEELLVAQGLLFALGAKKTSLGQKCWGWVAACNCSNPARRPVM